MDTSPDKQSSVDEGKDKNELAENKEKTSQRINTVELKRKNCFLENGSLQKVLLKAEAKKYLSRDIWHEKNFRDIPHITSKRGTFHSFISNFRQESLNFNEVKTLHKRRYLKRKTSSS